MAFPLPAVPAWCRVGGQLLNIKHHFHFLPPPPFSILHFTVPAVISSVAAHIVTDWPDRIGGDADELDMDGTGAGHFSLVLATFLHSSSSLC